MLLKVVWPVSKPITRVPGNVRFTPERRHARLAAICPLSADICHRPESAEASLGHAFCRFRPPPPTYLLPSRSLCWVHVSCRTSVRLEVRKEELDECAQ